MTTQRLRTVVTIGGAVDNSLGSMTREFEQNTRRMNREVGSLSRQQTRLAARIKKAVLAGKDVSQLTRQYQSLSIRIKNAADEAERFGDLSERGARANQRLSDSFRQSAYAAGGIGMATAGFSALMTMSNQNTAEMDAIAKGYDMTLEQYKLWDGIAKRMGDGFDGTTIGDLVEELGNKTGELGVAGEMSKYEDALKALNLDPEKIDKMGAYDRFVTIMKQLQTATNKDRAKFAADEIFSGNANRVITYLKNTGVNFDDLLKKQKTMNLLTSQGVDGAKKYNSAFSSATATFGSAWEEVAGIVGGQVAPLLEKTARDFAVWFSNDANKAGLVDSLKSFGTQLKEVGSVVVDIGVAVNNTAQFFGGWGVVAKGIAAFLGAKMIYSLVTAGAAMITFGNTVRGLTATTGLFNAVLMANPIGLITAGVVGLASAAYLLYDNWGSVSEWWSGMIDRISEKWAAFKSYFGFGDDTNINVKNSIESTNDPTSRINAVAPASNSTVNQNVGEIVVNAAPGQSPVEVAQSVKAVFSSQKFFDPAEAF